MNDKYMVGFCAFGKYDYMTEKWLYSDMSKRDKLIFVGYDANMRPLQPFSTWPRTEWKIKIIDIALDFTKEFTGEVWLDNVRIK